MKNTYSVPQKTWDRWDHLAKHTFNSVYYKMCRNQELYLHPSAPIVSKQYWETVAWNAAWTASEAILEAQVLK